MKTGPKKSFSGAPKKSPKVTHGATQKVFKGSGGETGRATPPQVNVSYKPKGNP